MVLIDARSNDRFHGRNETIDPVAGHIPGALNRFFKDNLNAQGFFKSPEELRADFKSLVGDASPGKQWCTSAAQAYPPATICWRWKSPASRAAGSIPVRGANGYADPSRPIAT